ncbi:MAG TPA: LD-carboxypeptidase [Thermodesulfobacteriota bacterium]
MRPPRLRPGGTVALVAPSGPVHPEGLAAAEREVRRRGFRAAVDASVLARDRYLAGDDARRAREFEDAFRNPAIDAVLCLRGGYGATRILPALDAGLLRRYPKPLVGFSDITALHALAAKAGLVSIHGAMLGARPGPARVALDSLWRMLTDPRPAGAVTGPSVRALGRGRARGILVGGCLALVTSLIGTPWQIDTRGAILLLEDVDEPAYRIDRMLVQLGLTGALDEVRGVVVGAFERAAAGERASIRRVVQEVLGIVGVPVLYDFPAGHLRRNLALPLGAMVEIDADRRRLVCLEGAVA